MELVEIRDLDGPNLFLLEPAIKVEFRLRTEGPHADAAVRSVNFARIGVEAETAGSVQATLCGAVNAIHQLAGISSPVAVCVPLETGGHIAVAFGWSHRRAAMRIARLLAELGGEGDVDVDAGIVEIRLLATTTEPGDAPELVRDEERAIPVIGVTGTNGKTTTTRLISHILRTSGRRVGWSSSSGVYIEGELVLEGDYTGPAGARRVLTEPNLDVAVLETARGGILLRGIAYESNDVGVVTNISADHLDLQGVRTLEGLAKVKSTVVRVTRADGFAVLNADDLLVRGMATDVDANVFFVSQHGETPVVQEHIRGGGWALIADDGDLRLWRDGESAELASVADIPITFKGRARHMVENALCAAAACLGIGLEPVEIRRGLESFYNSPEDNRGRLNVFDVGGVKVVVDFAHNEAGLKHLLMLGQSFCTGDGTLVSIIGTAGDRTDESLRALGELAASASSRVLIKETKKYLRGRANNDEMNRLYVEGIERSGTAAWSIAPNELSALEAALATSSPGDVVVIMCVEQIEDVQRLLSSVGTPAG